MEALIGQVKNNVADVDLNPVIEKLDVIEEKVDNIEVDFTPVEDKLDAIIEALHTKPVVNEDSDVLFIDYDGTPLYGFTKEEALALTELPEAPDHSGDRVPLTFQEWNYSIEDMVDTVNDCGKCIVGATYVPTDGKTHIIFNVDENDKQVGMSYIPKASGKSDVVVDWGDGNVETLTASSDVFHTYDSVGKYHCTITNAYTVRMGNFNPDYISDYYTKWSSTLGKVIEVFCGSECTTIEYSFQGCHNLKTVTIPKSVTKLDYTFNTCCDLRNVTIPKSVTSIGNGTFNNCYALRNVTIPKSVTIIGSSTFYSCYDLKNVVIPKSITLINLNAINGCCSLKSVTIPSSAVTVEGGTFGKCYNLENVKISEGVVAIGSSTFHSCYDLKNVVIPKTVTLIGNVAFNNCLSMSMITLKPIAPPTLESYKAFVSAYLKRIIVPKGSLEAYQSASNWSTYASIMEEADE